MPRVKHIEAVSSFQASLKTATCAKQHKYNKTVKYFDSNVRSHLKNHAKQDYYETMKENQKKFYKELQQRRQFKEPVKKPQKIKRVEPQLFVTGCQNARIKCFSHSKSESIHWWSERV